MFLYGDIVKASKHKYLVVSVDDSNPADIKYGLVRCTKEMIKKWNRTVTLPGVEAFKPRYWYRGDVLEFVELG